jgi:N-acetylglucosaminyldiphosphoundecaprenol N-acetyl-beta-D-mannosaminyltransferase
MPNVLNISIYNKSISSIVNEVIAETQSIAKKNKLISATGAHGIVTAQKDDNFKETLNSFHINLPDGIPAVWIGRLKGARNMTHCYGPDVFKEVIVNTSKQPIKHYFCGGKPGVAEALKKVCEEKFGNHNIAGTYSPPFREMTDNELKILAGNINNTGTNIVWIGLSTPKQEMFAKRLSNYTNVHFIITVGAAFDFHTGRLREAPKWIQKAGMEWFFRLVMEPKRLWKRYFEIVPLFIWYNLLEIIKGQFFQHDNEVINEQR